MPERTLHTVYVGVDIEAYDWMHATECVRAELEAMLRMKQMSPMFEDVVTMNITGREESLELNGSRYYRELPHNPRDLNLLRSLQGAYVMGRTKALTLPPDSAERGGLALIGLLDSVRDYYRSVTGRSIEP